MVSALSSRSLRTVRYWVSFLALEILKGVMKTCQNFTAGLPGTARVYENLSNQRVVTTGSVYTGTGQNKQEIVCEISHVQ